MKNPCCEHLFGSLSTMENCIWNPNIWRLPYGLDYESYVMLENSLDVNIFSVIGQEFYDVDSDTSCFSIEHFCRCGLNPISLLISRLWHCARLDYRLFMYDKECGKSIMKETQRYREDLFSVLERFSHSLVECHDLKFNLLAYVMLSIPLFCLHNEYHLRSKSKECSVFPNFRALPRFQLTFRWLIDHVFKF